MKWTVKTTVTTYQDWYDIEASSEEEAISKVQLSDAPSDDEYTDENYVYSAELQEGTIKQVYVPKYHQESEDR